MDKPSFTVVITTYNRADLLTQAVESVLAQNRPDTEILIIDDASTDNIGELVSRKFPQARYMRQTVNRGPGLARNVGIREASRSWILLMDDDDTLLPGAFDRIWHCMNAVDTAGFPVLQFATSDGVVTRPFVIVRLEDYFKNVLYGDFTPMIQKQKFLAYDYCYPDIRIGGENILWWKIAADHGIPTWEDRVVKVGHGASQRLTSTEHQIKNARDYARLQEITIETFAPVMTISSPGLLLTKRLGAATYWLLAGERRLAMQHIKAASKDGYIFTALLFQSMRFLPLRIFRLLFLLYRRLTRP